jgi:hypothetical protein
VPRGGIVDFRRGKALAGAIKDPLKSELIGLLREHKSLSATKRYQEASGKDYETCMFVIYELEPEARQGTEGGNINTTDSLERKIP